MQRPEQLILAVDVGNSRIKFGMFRRAPKTSVRTFPECVAALTVSVAGHVDWAMVTAHFEEWEPLVTTAVVAGANPAGAERVLTGWPNGVWTLPVPVQRATQLPLKVNVEFPDKVGIDRLLDAVAANVLRPEGTPAVVVDSGTATTVDLVSATGDFEGGAILPGLELGARSLHQYTALLPLIDTESLVAGEASVLGRNTHDAIRSGLWFGQVGSIRELVTRLSESAARPPLVLVTGGVGRWLAPALGEHVRFEPDLALRGLAYMAQSRE